MSISSSAARFVAVPFVAPFSARPLRTGAGFFSTFCSESPFVFVVVRAASLPEAFLVDGFVDGLDSVRFGVSSFLRLEERGDSSIAVLGTFYYRICIVDGCSLLGMHRDGRMRQTFRGGESAGQGASIPQVASRYNPASRPGAPASSQESSTLASLCGRRAPNTTPADRQY